MNPLDRLDHADAQWTKAAEHAAQLKADLFDACAEAVRAGHTPDELAARLKARKTPEQLEAGFTFSGPYIRKKVREIGVPALPHGPKPKVKP